MSKFEEACRPVIFEQKHAEFSYWGKGSSFLIANSNNCYWVTASHVLINTGGHADSLRIVPSDNSQISLSFNEQYTVNKGSADDEDYKDIFMLRIDLNEFDSSGDAPLVAQDIDQGILRAERLEPNDHLWVIGYPSESNFIDYESCAIKNTRSVLRAVYRGRSVSDYCHELIIESSIKLENYDGLSGGPVFHMKQVNRNGQVAAYPLLVGMLLRGTASSGIAHFVSSSVIVDIVNLLENNA
ncbi:MAG: serine protease [Pseudomonadota bacterium]|nr:serine protease [Pseudomonadota bacterium]